MMGRQETINHNVPPQYPVHHARLGAETIQWNKVLELKQSVLYHDAQFDERDAEKVEFMQSMLSNPAWEHADLGLACTKKAMSMEPTRERQKLFDREYREWELRRGPDPRLCKLH